MDNLEKFIENFQDVPSCSPNDLLGKALESSRTSHDAVFVFDEGSFVGLISPNYCEFEKRYPLNTKVKNCLLHPPFITSSTSVQKAAQFMVDMNVYTLPIFDDKQKVIGVVNSAKILQRIIKEKNIIEDLAREIKPQKVQTATEKATIKEIYEAFRNTDQSKMVLVDDNGKLKAIITRNEIEKALMSHRKRERYSARVGEQGKNFMRIESEPDIDETPAIEFASKSVISIEDKEKIKNTLNKMVDKNVSSIIILGKYGRPEEIISAGSILKALANLYPTQEIPILFHHSPDGPTKDYKLENLRAILEKFGGKVNKRFPIQRMELYIEQPKNLVGKTFAYTVKLRLSLWSGKSFFASVEEYVARSKHLGLETSVREATKEIEKQLEKNEGKIKKR